MPLSEEQIAAQRIVLQESADEEAFPQTVRALMLYLSTWKRESQGWRTVLNNHFNRAKRIGGPIIPSIQACHSVWPAIRGGGGFEAELTIENSLAVGDGLQLVCKGNGNSQKDAVDNMCHKALAILLLTDASNVLIQPAQWNIDGDAIVDAAVTYKRLFFEKWLDASAIGDMRMGDEQPRVQPPPSARARAASSARPQPFLLPPMQKEERDDQITYLLGMEIAEYGAAWPFMLHRGRWRILNELLEPGALRPWVDEHDHFKITQDPRNPRRWGIALA